MQLWPIQTTAGPVQTTFPERTTPDKWHPEISRPRWDSQRTQFTYPVAISNLLPIAPGETIQADKWHPELARPRWDVTRAQAVYPAEFRGDLPRAEAVSADRWHPEIQRPPLDVRRAQFLAQTVGFTRLVPPPLVTANPNMLALLNVGK